jgi:Raf kinase inhibitor-like YbhB/YbcL family protein
MRTTIVIALILLFVTACQSPTLDTSQAVKFKLSSPAFQDSGSIPQKFTCQGDNVSPELNWSEAPPNTKSFALIMDDPDAPGGTFTHWVLFDIPADQQQLAEGAGSSSTGNPIGMSGNNGLSQIGYMGPCPPSGIHRYYFRMYALDVPSLNLKEGASRGEVEAAMKNHVIGAADTMSRYEQQ